MDVHNVLVTWQAKGVANVQASPRWAPSDEHKVFDKSLRLLLPDLAISALYLLLWLAFARILAMVARHHAILGFARLALDLPCLAVLVLVLFPLLCFAMLSIALPARNQAKRPREPG